jgi:hypothetical protein
MGDDSHLERLYRLRWLFRETGPGLNSKELSSISQLLYLVGEGNSHEALAVARQIIDDAEPASDIDRELVRMVGEVARGIHP